MLAIAATDGAPLNALQTPPAVAKAGEAARTELPPAKVVQEAKAVPPMAVQALIRELSSAQGQKREAEAAADEAEQAEAAARQDLAEAKTAEVAEESAPVEFEEVTSRAKAEAAAGDLSAGDVAEEQETEKVEAEAVAARAAVKAGAVEDAAAKAEAVKADFAPDEAREPTAFERDVEVVRGKADPAPEVLDKVA